MNVSAPYQLAMTRVNKEHLNQEAPRWYAIYTKFKSEKFVASNLEKKGIVAYVPLIEKTKRYQRKIKKYQIPLINSYVFVNILPHQRTPVLETEYVSKFIRIGKDLSSIPEEEINVLKRIVGDIEEVVVSPLGFNVGDQVEIIAGQLSGLSGKLVTRVGKKSFIVELNHIGIQLSMNIDLSQLQKTIKYY